MEQESKETKVEKKASKGSGGKLTAVIRISGMVKVKSEIVSTLDRLRLRRKYACVVIDSSKKDLKGMLNKVKFHVAYGVVSKEMLVKLIEARGQVIKKGGKINGEGVVDGLMSGKKLSDFGLKPFFRLHPPRKGIKSKLQYPRGVLGNNGNKINELIGRML